MSRESRPSADPAAITVRSNPLEKSPASLSKRTWALLAPGGVLTVGIIGGAIGMSIENDSIRSEAFDHTFYSSDYATQDVFNRRGISYDWETGEFLIDVAAIEANPDGFPPLGTVFIKRNTFAAQVEQRVEEIQDTEPLAVAGQELPYTYNDVRSAANHVLLVDLACLVGGYASYMYDNHKVKKGRDRRFSE